MVSQLATIGREVVVTFEVVLGAALLLAWAAVEIIGYAGVLWRAAANQQWVAVRRPVKPAHDIRWGTAVRAAGFRAQRRQHA
jgi:hypothetical protein